MPQSSKQHFPLSCIYHGEDPAELAFNKSVVTDVMLCVCGGGWWVGEKLALQEDIMIWPNTGFELLISFSDGQCTFFFFCAVFVEYGKGLYKGSLWW